MLFSEETYVILLPQQGPLFRKANVWWNNREIWLFAGIILGYLEQIFNLGIERYFPMTFRFVTMMLLKRLIQDNVTR